MIMNFGKRTIPTCDGNVLLQPRLLNAVAILQVCLGTGAKEESNVVEVTALNHRGKKVSVPVANLHVSCLPMVPAVLP